MPVFPPKCIDLVLQDFDPSHGTFKLDIFQGGDEELKFEDTTNTVCRMKWTGAGLKCVQEALTNCHLVQLAAVYSGNDMYYPVTVNGVLQDPRTVEGFQVNYTMSDVAE